MAWLFNQLPFYQRIGQAAYKANLDNTLKLVAYLDHPELKFKSIHVAGTNGKGSVSHMLASVFQEAGYKVGLYTSPHLKDFRERIKINGKPISKEQVVDFVAAHKRFFKENELSFFEMTVGMAFDFFRNEGVDLAIVEVGMGGRLDSTNIILPELSIITNIGFDHTQFLGNTIESIAKEKAGIIKPGIPVVIGETVNESKSVFSKIAKECKAPIYFAAERETCEFESDLKGNYQKHNIQTACIALKILREQGWKLTDDALKAGFNKVVENTSLLGRWQVIGNVPKVICDTAHNKEGLINVLAQLKEEAFDRLHIVLGMVSDKDFKQILPLFPKSANYYFCAPNLPRAMPAKELAQKAEIYGLNGTVYKSVKQAYNAALNSASGNDLIFIGGSTFVVAEVL